MFRISAVLILIILSSCSSPSVLIRPNVPIERLGIYFETGDLSTVALSSLFSSHIDDFIIRYNASSAKRFTLYRASKPDSTTLCIRLAATRLVSPGQQTAGVVVSMMGLATPIIMASAGAPIILFFYYFPQAKSMIELSLSPDLNNMPQSPKGIILGSPGFLISPERQVDKHGISFEKFLGNVVKSIENQYKPVRRTPVATAWR